MLLCVCDNIGACTCVVRVDVKIELASWFVAGLSPHLFISFLCTLLFANNLLRLGAYYKPPGAWRVKYSCLRTGDHL